MQTFIRILQIIFIFLIVNLVALLIVIQFIDVDHYKNIFEQQLTKKLERPVSIENASLKFSWSEGVTLELKDLHVEEVLDVALSQVVFDIKTFIKSRAMIVEEIRLVRPHVRLIAKEERAAEKNIQESVVEEEQKESEQAKMPEIGIRKVEIVDGSLTYADYRRDSPAEVRVGDIDVEIEKFQFDQFFKFALSASVWSGKQNINLSGQAMILSVAQQWKLGETNITLDLGELELKEVMESYADAGFLKDIDYVSGDLHLSVDEIVQKNNKMESIQAALSMTNGELKHSGLKSSFKNIVLKTNWQHRDIYIDEVQFSLAEGRGVLSGNIRNVFTIPVYDLDFDLKDVQIRQLFDQEKWPFIVEGKIQGQMAIDGNGFSEQEITQSLNGTGVWKVTEGKLVDFNLLREVLNQLDFAPNIQDKLSIKYKEKLAAKDTILNKIQMDFGIAAGNIVLRKGELAAEGFLHASKGSLNFNQNLDLEASLYITNELSQELISAVEEFSYFQDQYGQIVLPFKRYNGPASKYFPRPDVKNILKGAVRQKAKEEAQKAILKALDIDEAPQTPTEDGTPPQPKPEQILIENVLDSLGIFE